MEPEEAKQEIPDYQGPVADIPAAEETASVTTEEAKTTASEEVKPEEPNERLKMENDAFRKYFAELNREMEEIRKKFPEEGESVEADPVSVLSGELESLKTGFNELKSILEKQEAAKGQAQSANNQIPPPQTSPYGSFQPQFPYGYGAQPMFTPGPMYQTSTILPAPALPYFQTPNFYPMNTTLPHISGNAGNREGGHSK